MNQISDKSARFFEASIWLAGTDKVDMEPGDTFVIESPGGGGYGKEQAAHGVHGDGDPETDTRKPCHAAAPRRERHTAARPEPAARPRSGSKSGRRKSKGRRATD